jgi:hypothetical protein
MPGPLGTHLLKIKVGSVEYTAEVSKCEVVGGPADSDFTSFADAAAGGAREYRLALTFRQDLSATGTLWRLLWASAGTSVAVRLNPYGNVTASVTEPHYTGNITVTEPDGTIIGGEANSSRSARFTNSVEWVFSAKPVEVTTGTF